MDSMLRRLIRSAQGGDGDASTTLRMLRIERKLCTIGACLNQAEKSSVVLGLLMRYCDDCLASMPDVAYLYDSTRPQVRVIVIHENRRWVLEDSTVNFGDARDWARKARIAHGEFAQIELRNCDHVASWDAWENN